jgi:hypothetical protein
MKDLVESKDVARGLQNNPRSSDTTALTEHIKVEEVQLIVTAESLGRGGLNRLTVISGAHASPEEAGKVASGRSGRKAPSF